MSEKFRLVIEEKLTYTKEVEFEFKGVTEATRDNILDEALRCAESAEDVAIRLSKHPLMEVTKYPDRDYSSPREVEVEEYDFMEVDK